MREVRSVGDRTVGARRSGRLDSPDVPADRLQVTVEFVEPPLEPVGTCREPRDAFGVRGVEVGDTVSVGECAFHGGETL